MKNNDHQSIWTIHTKEQEAFLRTKAAPFDFASMDKREIDDLIRTMRALMVQDKGVGLSANQIGYPFRMFVFQMPDKNGRGYVGKFYALFNPVVTEISERKAAAQEGCLSVPGLYGDVERFERLVLEAFDKNQRPVKLKAEGFMARIIQHEMDHLNGILFIDKATNLQTLDEIQAQDEEAL
jgi:peptide deformylase